jgi:CRP-like cAMP-binding protein
MIIVLTMKARSPFNALLILKTIPCFSAFSNEELSSLAHIIIERRFVKDEIILNEEESQRFMYIIYDGRVKVINISYEGKEQILAIHGTGDFFGEMALLDGKTSPATIIAMDNTIIGLISKSDFELHLIKDAKALKELSLMLCSRLREAWLKLKVLSFADAETRLRAFFTAVQHYVWHQGRTWHSYRYAADSQRYRCLCLSVPRNRHPHNRSFEQRR